MYPYAVSPTGSVNIQIKEAKCVTFSNWPIYLKCVALTEALEAEDYGACSLPLSRGTWLESTELCGARAPWQTDPAAAAFDHNLILFTFLLVECH